MKIIIGLGNPEKKYEKTYHNIGFYALDLLAQKFNASFSKTNCNGVFAEVFYHREKILLVKPQTYMNLSGDCVDAFKRKFKLANSQIFVISDDIDLKKGAFRFRESGSGGTHNGLKHIVQRIGEDFNRLRIGIDRPVGYDLADYVLSRIDNASLEVITPAIEQGLEVLMQKLREDNGKHTPTA